MRRRLNHINELSESRGSCKPTADDMDKWTVEGVVKSHMTEYSATYACVIGGNVLAFCLNNSHRYMAVSIGWLYRFYVCPYF